MCLELRQPGNGQERALPKGRDDRVSLHHDLRHERIRDPGGLALGQVAPGGRALCESLWPTFCAARLSGERSAGEGKHQRRLQGLPPTDPRVSEKRGRLHRAWIRLLFVPGERQHRPASRHRDVRTSSARAHPELTDVARTIPHFHMASDRGRKFYPSERISGHRA
jgi:hypothetical protein